MATSAQEQNEAVVSWVDLSAIGVSIGVTRDASGRSGLTLLDERGVYSAQIRALGFVPAQGNFREGVWFRVGSGSSVTKEMLHSAFGAENVRWVKDTRSRFATLHHDRVREHTAMNARAFMAQQVALGVNFRGETVCESLGGRYVMWKDHESKQQVRLEMPDADPAAFLRVVDAQGLNKVADGFVRRILDRGHKLRREQLLELIKVSNDAGFEDRAYFEAVEAALTRAFRAGLEPEDIGMDAFGKASHLFQSAPDLRFRTSASMANQQYSTPLPMSVLAQVIVGRGARLPAGASVLEPTIGNASLVSLLDTEGVQVCGVELDAERVALAQTVSGRMTVVHGDATSLDFQAAFGVDGFDAVIANPPFGGCGDKVELALPEGSLEPSMIVRRLDHLICLRALHARRDDGRAVFIVGADSAMGNGEVKGGSAHFLAYLHDHYQIDGVVEVSGDLFKKMGASYPTRMIAVGPRLEAPRRVTSPERLHVVRSFDELRTWADAVLAYDGRGVVPGVVAAQPDEELGAVAPLPLEVNTAPVSGLLERSSRSRSLDEAKATERSASVENDTRKESEFQQPYVAFSNVGEPTTMIPANLAGSVYAALGRIRELHGDIDAYVGRELQFSFNELGKFFSPEQVDAMAMIFAAHDKGLGFLLADQMGVGKGRTLAGVARRERLAGRVPVFITVKDSLFSDFLERDLVDIDSRHLFQAPLIINDASKTVNRDGEVVARAIKRDSLKAYAARGQLPEDTDIVLLTYSQICRDPSKHLISKYLLDLSGSCPLSLLLDESHNGAGSSNTSTNLCAMIDALGRRGSVLYSSATAIKGAANLRLYRKVLPQGANSDELLELVAADPLSLQEALNFEIAIQGCMISRELDNAGLEKEFVLSGRRERNIELARQMAKIFTAMSYLSGDVGRLLVEVNKAFERAAERLSEESRAGERMMASSANFGSRLYQLNRQFLLALKADDVLDMVRQAVADNCKPIVALEHTGESLLQDIVSGADEAYDDEVKVKELSDGKKVRREPVGPVYRDRPVNFKDLLRRYLDRIQTVTVTAGYGKVEKRGAADLAKTKASAEAFHESVRQIGLLIDDLPDDLPLTPIDYVRDKLAAEGLTVAEVSGRNLMMRYLGDGSVAIEPVPGRSDKTRVNRAVREFNNGDVDVLMLTSSGSTGLSAQASPAVGRDTRRRVMVTWEYQSNIASERQMSGRPNRTGQLSKPIYRAPLTGLPADDRVAMMFNNKMRSLSSSTTANRDSDNLVRNVPDLLNVVGDWVAEELLLENSELARHLDIRLEGDDFERPPLWCINKLTGRIAMLDPDDQQKLYDELQARFIERVDRLTAEGRNPLMLTCHDWRAQLVAREVLMGDQIKRPEGQQSMFDTPVYLTTVEYTRSLMAVRANEVDARISEHRPQIPAGVSFDPEGDLREMTRFVADNLPSLLSRCLSRKHKSVADALSSKEENEVKLTNAKAQWLLANMPRLGFGSVFYETDLEGGQVPHVVLRAMAPSSRDASLRFSDYTLYTMEPGSDVIERKTLSTLFAKGVAVEPRRFVDHASARAEFDRAQNGIVRKRAQLLDGNLFEAASLNLREGVGSKVVYTDEHGVRQHGILLNVLWTPEKLRSLPERVRNVELLELALAANLTLTSHAGGVAAGDQAKHSLLISKDPKTGVVRLRVPGTKIRGGDVFLDPKIAHIPEKPAGQSLGLRFVESGDRMVSDVPNNLIYAVIEHLVAEKNINFYFSGLAREKLRHLREQRSECVSGKQLVTA